MDALSRGKRGSREAGMYPAENVFLCLRYKVVVLQLGGTQDVPTNMSALEPVSSSPSFLVSNARDAVDGVVLGRVRSTWH